MPPAPTDLLNQDINRLTGVIDKLASKVEDETKWSRQFQLDLTKTLGEINTKIGGMQTTIRIAGAIATLATGFVLYAGRNMYQTVFTEGEKVGALQAKIDMMETKFNEHIRNQTQPTSYKVSPPGQPAIPAPDTPHPPGQSLAPDVPSTLPSFAEPRPTDVPSELRAVRHHPATSDKASPHEAPQ